MNKKKIIERELIKKRNEVIISLWTFGYSYTDLSFIFNIAHTTVSRIIAKNK